MYIADLHIHSRYSRATSRDCTPEYLDLWARRKGIHLLGTGDFTHPAWRQELEEKLIPAEEGLYVLKEELRIKGPAADERVLPRFVVSGEISSIYKKNGKVRKVHSLILLPGLEKAGRLADRLETIGNIHSDGRPILGLDCRDLLEITLEICPDAIFVPAHIWTPHFSMFGAFSGFDTVEECFEDLAPYVRAVETGLSSDPPMNWRLSALDRFQLISNSDAHSPAKLGREANLLDIEMSYGGLYHAVLEGQGLKGTIEFFPEEGKYHFDGHRKCHLCLSPEEAVKYGGRCPVCGKKLTMGVFHRILQLADREEGFVPEKARAFESLVPLPEVIAASTGQGASGANTQRQYEKMIEKLGSEFFILREAKEEDIERTAGSLIAEGIRRLRAGKVERLPGFDGEYGTIKLFRPSELGQTDGQMDMFLMNGWNDTAQTEKKEEAPGAFPHISLPEEPQVSGEQEISEAPNQEQLLAIKSVSPRLAVMAGPGTGKTKTLVSRILYLLQNRKVKPSEITAVTFTRKAAEELNRRLEQQLGSRQGLRRMQIGTFHSICWELLKKQGAEFLLADRQTALGLAAETAGELGLKEKPGKLLQIISQIKTRSAIDGQESYDNGDPYRQAVLRYQEKLREAGALDFDDLLIKALDFPESQSFRYLLVDEFQDISPLEYRLIRTWSSQGREVFIIGDPNQAIYGFRGAETESFSAFQNQKDTEIISLKKNYRSTPEILTASQQMLYQGSMPSPLESVKPSGFPVRLKAAPGEMAEAVFIAKEINRLVGGIDMLDAQEDFACPENRTPRGFSDIAVLYRTHRQAELLEKCLKTEGIPYIVTGRESYLEEECVRGTLGFFKALLNPKDVLAEKQCMKLLKTSEGQPLTQEAWGSLKETYGRLLKRTQPHKLFSRWIEERGLTGEPSMEKLMSAAVFYKTMPEFLDSLSFGGEADIRRCGGRTYTSDAVTLMTLHASKGLEFPAVFLFGARKGTIPLEWGGTCENPEEERRLLYVGMTRAMEELILTSSAAVSPFLEPIPPDLLLRETVKAREVGTEARQMSLFDFMK